MKAKEDDERKYRSTFGVSLDACTRLATAAAAAVAVASPHDDDDDDDDRETEVGERRIGAVTLAPRRVMSSIDPSISRLCSRTHSPTLALTQRLSCRHPTPLLLPFSTELCTTSLARSESGSRSHGSHPLALFLKDSVCKWVRTSPSLPPSLLSPGVSLRSRVISYSLSHKKANEDMSSTSSLRES